MSSTTVFRYRDLHWT